MAISTNNPLLKNVHGQLGKTVVFKTYSYGTVISNYPDMSKVKPSVKQLKEKRRFKAAVHYAKTILADSKKKAALKAKLAPGQSVYHAAIAEFMKKNK